MTEHNAQAGVQGREPEQTGQVAPAAAGGGAPSHCDVVVKIGGSACTNKAVFETLNTVALEASARQLAELRGEGARLAIIHGAGSFGHQQAREYGVSKGVEAEERWDAAPGDKRLLPSKLLEGAARCRLSVTTLNKHVVAALLEAGVPAMTVSPSPFVLTDMKKLRGGRLPDSVPDALVGMISRGLVPVVHGDVALDEAQGVAILSGDVWMVELCRELRARTAVFLTDVDGVFTAPPTEPGAQLIREMLVDPTTGQVDLCGVSMTTAAHDVTGGLKAKLDSAIDVLRQSATVESVCIVRAGSPSAAQALRGQVPADGTVLRRRAS